MKKLTVLGAALIVTRFITLGDVLRIAPVIGIAVLFQFGMVDAQALPLMFIGMAQPADSLQIADLKAVTVGGLVAEDVLRTIYDITEGIPQPMLELLQESPVKNPATEWTTDELGAASSTNKAVDGDNIEPATAATGARVKNYCQILTKGVNVAEGTEHSDNFGRTLAYRTMREIKSMRRDLEASITSRNASIAPTASVAGQLGGLGAWLETNVSRGIDGADGGFNTSTGVVDAPDPGDKRALTWALFTDQVENVYNEGGMPTIVTSVGGVIKRISRFLLGSTAPAATPTANVSGESPSAQTSQGFVEIIRTDFGFTMKLVPNRLQPTYASDDSTPSQVADVFGISPEYLAIGNFWNVKVEPLAKLGLSIRRMISRSTTLKVLNEKAHFCISDIDPTAAVTAT